VKGKDDGDKEGFNVGHTSGYGRGRPMDTMKDANGSRYWGYSRIY